MIFGENILISTLWANFYEDSCVQKAETQGSALPQDLSSGFTLGVNPKKEEIPGEDFGISGQLPFKDPSPTSSTEQVQMKETVLWYV